MRRLCAAGFLAGLCLITACSSPPGGTRAASPATPTATGNTGATVSPASPAAPSGPASPAVRSGPASPAVRSGPASPAVRNSQAASPLAQPPPAPAVTTTRMRLADGSAVTVATFSGPVQYVLHNGSGDPGAAAASVGRARPEGTGAERKGLLAAFNGGVKLGARVGGYEQEGHVISPLRRGHARRGIVRSGPA